MLRRFFDVFAAWPWATEPIALANTAGGGIGGGQLADRVGRAAAVTVLTPTAGRNACRSVSASTACVLAAELARAALAMKQAQQPQPPPPPQSQSQAQLQLALEQTFVRVASPGRREFLASRDHFLVVEVMAACQTSGSSSAADATADAAADAVGWLGSRTVPLVACLERGQHAAGSCGGGGDAARRSEVKATHLRPWPSVFHFGGGWQPRLFGGDHRGGGGGALVVGVVVMVPSGGGGRQQGLCGGFEWALEEAVLGPFRAAFPRGHVQCRAGLVVRKDISLPC